MTPLRDLTEALAWLRGRGVVRLQTDSRQVQAGDAFIAWPGFATDGRRFVPAALAAGAVACLVEADGLANAMELADGSPAAQSAVASLAGLKAATGELAAAFHGHPSREVKVVAITGTNGKTSTAWWLAQALTAAGHPAGIMGTLGVGLPGPADNPLAQVQPTGLTTPDPVTVQHTLRQWADAGVGACAVEASSIGLVEHRLAGTELAVAVFTNFTQDHLDFHGTMAHYWAAKQGLFDAPQLGAAVVNVDDPQGLQLALALDREARLDLWTISLHPDQHARLCVTRLAHTTTGMHLSLREGGHTVTLALPLVGDYNATNVLGVVATLRALGVGLLDAVAACHQLGPVPGRMAAVNPQLDLPAGADGDALAAALPLVLVDYAHTPDALHKALLALQPVATARGGQLHCVVGCGGDRDAGKRPLMAAAAEALSDQLCLTSDNPRSESPQAILDQMVAGLRDPLVARVVVDRAQAIATQVAMAAAADVVLIAGKGHETTQEVAGVKHPFSDHAHALAALQARVHPMDRSSAPAVAPQA
ncbi:MAG: UDP-N-acetylmuramoyl-L-alanyl-D-glutamate--2,6-diaminopimelate ligase [Polaromonas sp.]|nr:UDP-N-acetylmuramoyl-L-alanyl-D-glutamate--2,6-diaminopimelate ligase [Polaromonas sp.]